MCRLCEGASWDDVIADAGRHIAVNGYMLFGVTGDDHHPWVYTAGLIDAAGHPELIIAGVSTATSAKILNALAEAVIKGDQFEVGEHVGARAHLVRIAAVDAVQYDLDAFAIWHRLRDAGVLRAQRLSAVQVILEHGFCPEHESVQPMLSDPKAEVGGRRVPANRAARRRRSSKPPSRPTNN